MPFTPGSEVGGVIRSIGAKFSALNIGDRVVAIPGIGGLAEQVIVKSESVRRIPDNMDFKTAAGFAMVYNFLSRAEAAGKTTTRRNTACVRSKRRRRVVGCGAG